MPEENQSTTQPEPVAPPADGGTGEEGGEGEATQGTANTRGGADGKAKTLGLKGVGDYGRPSIRDGADKADPEAI